MWFWLYVRPTCFGALIGSSPCCYTREVAKGPLARQEEVGAASYGGEGRQPFDHFPDRPLRDFEFQRAVVGADDRIAFVAELMEGPVIGPHILGELELPDETDASHECSNATFHAVFRRAFGQRWSIGSAAPNHP